MKKNHSRTLRVYPQGGGHSRTFQLEGILIAYPHALVSLVQKNSSFSNFQNLVRILRKRNKVSNRFKYADLAKFYCCLVLYPKNHPHVHIACLQDRPPRNKLVINCPNDRYMYCTVNHG